MSMKITEIQIGDWVYNKFHKKPIRITPYDFFTHGHRSDGEQYLLGNSKPAIGRDYDPIPITTEILEKNGFLPKDGYYCMVDDYFGVSIDEYSDSIWRVEYESLEMNLPISRVLISYVHELQHFLALIGISKQIVL